MASQEEGEDLPDEVLKHIINGGRLKEEGNIMDMGTLSNVTGKQPEDQGDYKVATPEQLEAKRQAKQSGGPPVFFAAASTKEMGINSEVSAALSSSKSKNEMAGKLGALSVGVAAPSYMDYCLDEEGGGQHASKSKTAENENNENLPLRPLQVGRNVSTTSEPGAYPHGGGESMQFSESFAQIDSFDSGPLSIADSKSFNEDFNADPTPVAKAVDEEAQSTDDLPQAESVDVDTLDSKRRGREKRHWKAGLLLLTAIGVVVVLVLVLALVLPNKGSEPDHYQPSSSPSFAPTSFEDYALSMLPQYTREAIEDDPKSAQANAFQWLKEDTSHNPLITEQRLLQRFSLATLFFATDGENWVLNDNWLNHTAHECEWSIGTVKSQLWPRPPPSCDEDGIIRHINLKKNNLFNALPLELYLLTSLETLDIGLNRLQGSISSHVGHLTALEGLWIYSLQNGGEIPTQVGLLTMLQALSFSGNEHTGKLPSEIGSLTALEGLFVGQNHQLQGSISPITTLPRLKQVSFDRNDHTGTIPTEVGLLKDLRWLLVGANRLHGTIPSQIWSLTNIGAASFYRNELEGTLPTELGLITSSSLLSFGHNNFSGTVPSQLGVLTNMTLALTLESNPLLTGTIPTQLGLLTGLYLFNVANNNHTGPIPSEFGMMKSLGRLDLGNNSLQGTIPTTLATLHQSLYEFDIHSNPLLSGTLPEELCSINGTCIPHTTRPPCSRGTNVAFDCTDLLTGCNCSSNNTGNGTEV